jgi:hypothetical protein
MPAAVFDRTDDLTPLPLGLGLEDRLFEFALVFQLGLAVATPLPNLGDLREPFACPN